MVKSNFIKIVVAIILLFSLNLIVGSLILNNTNITIIKNTGTSLGLLQNNNITMIIVTSLINLAIIYTLLKSLKDKTIDLISMIGLILIISGGLSNLYDRIVYGYVVDYINFWFIPTFNTADSMITIGIVLIIYRLLKN